MTFVHHETISARNASESSGVGNFNVIETDEGFCVYDGDSAMKLHERGTLEEAIQEAQKEADGFDARCAPAPCAHADITWNPVETKYQGNGTAEVWQTGRCNGCDKLMVLSYDPGAPQEQAA